MQVQGFWFRSSSCRCKCRYVYVLSIKKLIDSKPDELLTSALRSYGSSLAAMGNSGAAACPPAGSELKQSLLNLQQRLSQDATPHSMTETEQCVEKELRQFGVRAAGYFKQKAEEFKEIILMMARTADSVGERDLRYTKQFGDFSARLQSIADLHDLTEIRTSLVQSAAELKACVDRMTQDGRQAAALLRKDLVVYQTRLQEAEKQASVDTLTGLDNRRKVEIAIELRIATARRFCVMIFDLNAFKPINDLHGHLAGDEVLKHFAGKLKSAFRATDIVGRWGGDEFIVVLDGGIEEAQAQADRARQWVFGDYTINPGAGPQKIHLEAAIGLAMWKEGETMAQVQSRADAAMYKDKARRRIPRAAMASPPTTFFTRRKT